MDALLTICRASFLTLTALHGSFSSAGQGSANAGWLIGRSRRVRINYASRYNEENASRRVATHAVLPKTRRTRGGTSHQHSYVVRQEADDGGSPSVFQASSFCWLCHRFFQRLILCKDLSCLRVCFGNIIALRTFIRWLALSPRRWLESPEKYVK